MFGFCPIQLTIIRNYLYSAISDIIAPNQYYDNGFVSSATSLELFRAFGSGDSRRKFVGISGCLKVIQSETKLSAGFGPHRLDSSTKLFHFEVQRKDLLGVCPYATDTGNRGVFERLLLNT
jgi:hypothetical protein